MLQRAERMDTSPAMWEEIIPRIVTEVGFARLIPDKLKSFMPDVQACSYLLKETFMTEHSINADNHSAADVTRE